ncbi:hypothetical protein D917_09177 [Trichinella nativa]|uniref:Uncharacterized protein n=1 Tax=Trichinella nativa TaxID=6335 RepID=A0A1Y3EGT7_9BILA|nr:hypothetical protein D917_09177 [Trichinella nativa]
MFVMVVRKTLINLNYFKSSLKKISVSKLVSPLNVVPSVPGKWNHHPMLAQRR